jgi:hypothetical protein
LGEKNGTGRIPATKTLESLVAEILPVTTAGLADGHGGGRHGRQDDVVCHLVGRLAVVGVVVGRVVRADSSIGCTALGVERRRCRDVVGDTV